MITIALDKITINGGTQPRAAINQPTVDAYAALSQDGRQAPPVLVYHDGATYWLVDGFHRYHAARKLGAASIAADIRPGTKPEAQYAALGANAAHGLPMNNADKAKAIEIALRLRPDLSDRAIAGHIGCTHPTVSSHRSRLHSTGKIYHLPTRTGANGKTYASPPPPDMPLDEPRPAGPDAADDIPFDPPPGRVVTQAEYKADAATASPPPAGATDNVGQPIDGAIAAAFARRKEINKLTTGITAILGVVRKAADAKDALFISLNLAGFEADLTNARRRLRAIRPYAKCPYCAGDGCKACHSLGYVGQLIYDAAPQEMKA